MTPEGLSRLREAFREAGVGFYKFRVRKKPATKVAVGPDPARPKTVYVRFGRNVPRKKHTSAGGKQLSFEF